jgi:hypothetical protein
MKICHYFNLIVWQTICLALTQWWHGASSNGVTNQSVIKNYQPWEITLQYSTSTMSSCRKLIEDKNHSKLGILYGLGGGGADKSYHEMFQQSHSTLHHYLKELHHVIKNVRNVFGWEIPIALVIFDDKRDNISSTSNISSIVETFISQGKAKFLHDNFDCIIINQLPILSKEWGEKIPTLLQTPFEQTIFLDLDTIICHNFLNEVKRHFFATHYEMGMVGEYATTLPISIEKSMSDLGYLNTGVIFYKKTNCIWKLFVTSYLSHTHGSDQYFIFYHRTRHPFPCFVTELPVEYNLRINRLDRAAFLTDAVRIVHARLRGELDSKLIRLHHNIVSQYGNVCDYVNNVTTRRLIWIEDSNPQMFVLNNLNVTT